MSNSPQVEIHDRSQDRILKISAHSLSGAASCSTRAALHALGYTALEPSAAQFSGSCGHAAMAEWQRGKEADEAVNLFWTLYGPWAEANAVNIDDRLKPNNCAKILRTYFQRYAGRSLWEPLGVEEPFEVNLSYDGKTHLIGTFDVRATGTAYLGLSLGQDIVVETKFVGRISSLWVQGYDEDPQITAYWYAHETKYPERLLCAAVLNVIEFSKLPQTPRICNEHDRAMVVCNQFGTHARFRQFIVHRQPDQIESWRNNALALTEKYRQVITRFDTLEKASKAPQEGMFLRGSHDLGCNFCDFKSYCFAHRPVHDWANHMAKPEPDAQKVDGRAPFVRSGFYDV